MDNPEYYNIETSVFALAIFGLAGFGINNWSFLMGQEARGSIAKVKTYRVRTGNGHYGSTLGQKYQDTMDYYTPTNPQSGPQQANRANFAGVVADAKALTEEQKLPYIERAKARGGQSWFSQYMSENL